jgi:hypothetical protein
VVGLGAFDRVCVSGDLEKCSGGFGEVVRDGVLSVVHLGY